MKQALWPLRDLAVISVVTIGMAHHVDIMLPARPSSRACPPLSGEADMLLLFVLSRDSCFAVARLEAVTRSPPSRSWEPIGGTASWQPAKKTAERRAVCGSLSPHPSIEQREAPREPMAIGVERFAAPDTKGLAQASRSLSGHLPVPSDCPDLVMRFLTFQGDASAEAKSARYRSMSNQKHAAHDSSPVTDGGAEFGGPRASRRDMLRVGAGLAVAAAMGLPQTARAQDARFCAALGWTAGESGRHIVNGYRDVIAELGGTITMEDAGYDPKKQIEHIRAFVATKPSALFVTPCDPIKIGPALEAAVSAGVPVFCADSMVPIAGVTSSALSNNFGMGSYSATYIANRLKGAGKVGMVSLPTSHDAWDMRRVGALSVFKRYPNIKIVKEIIFDFASSMTRRDAILQILASSPDIDAVWCAWDDPAAEGALAVAEAGKEVFFTGIDGGQRAFEYIKMGSPFVLSLAQSFYEMTFTNAFYAHEMLAGRKTPRLVVTPTYAVTQESLAKLADIPDNYDRPGESAKLGWVRAL